MGDQAISCTREGCGRTFEGTGREEALVGHVVSQHLGFALPAAEAAPPPAAPPAAPKMPTIGKPKLSPNCSLVQYENFMGQWNLYKSGNKIPDDDAIPHFLSTLDEEIYAGLLREHADPATLELATIQEKVKDMAVIPIPVGLRRLEAFGIRQSAGQRFGDFYRQVCGQVLDCKYINPCTGCSCGHAHVNDYTNRVKVDILLAGIWDGDIRREVLAIDQITQKSPAEVVGIVEAKERALAEASGRSASAAPCHISRETANGTTRGDQRTTAVGTAATRRVEERAIPGPSRTGALAATRPPSQGGKDAAVGTATLTTFG